jgi:DNA-binding NtrC family response regulator
LNANRKSDLHVSEALRGPIADCTIGKERSQAFAAYKQQITRAANIQIGFLLAGEAGMGKILGRRARSNSDFDARAVRAPTEVG